jgi:hypothetical protein
MFKEFNQSDVKEKKSPDAQEVLKPSFTQEELRDRYEGGRRNFLAQEAWSKRKELRDSEKSRVDSLLKNLSSTEDSLRESDDIKKKMIRADNDVIYSQSIAPRRQAIETLKKKQEARNFFKKIQYKFKEDPLSLEINNLTQEIQKEESRIISNNSTLDLNLKEHSSYIDTKKESYATLVTDVEGEFLRKRKFLLEKTRASNRESREAITQTLEALKKGDLDIATLAKESNALVVHTIPLEGWQMANTSMNNTLVDTKSMSPQDKINTITEKQPDLSVSVISAGESIEGQGLMYPFGVILGGTLIASYERDSGLVVKGDSRIVKPEYGSTLQTNTTEMFGSVANQKAKGDRSWNESIVHKPNVKALFIDEEKLLKEYPGDMQKVFSYAEENYKSFPVYIRKQDGIYTKEGKKVTAEEIYS